MTRRWSRRAVLRAGGAGVAGTLAGCSFLRRPPVDPDGGSVTPAAIPERGDHETIVTPRERELTVAHWLNRPAHLAGYEALVRTFVDALGEVQVYPASGGGIRLTDGGLARYVRNDFAPGIWQDEPGGKLLSLADEGLLVDIGDTVWDRGDLESGYPEAVAAVARPTGEYVAVPWYGERLNNLFYNPSVLDAAGVDLSAVESPHDLQRACETIATETEATPLAQSTGRPWPLGHLFESVLLAQAGPSTVEAILAGDITAPARRTVRDALETVAKLRQYLPGDAVTLDIETIVDRVVSGSAAMTVCGDRAVGGPTATVGFANHEDAEFGHTWAHMPVPGTTDVFLFTAQSFVAPVNNPTPTLATWWLALCGSPLGQRRYSAAAGTIPLRTDTSGRGLSTFARRQFDAYRHASTLFPSITEGLVLPPESYSEYLTAMFRFANEWDVEATAGKVTAALAGR